MNLICAVDGSSGAAGVVRYAAHVASRAGADLLLVRAVQVADPMFVTSRVARSLGDPNERRAQVLTHAQRQLDELCGGIGGVVAANANVRQGAPDAEVLAAVAEHGAELIVVGTRPRRERNAKVGRDAQGIIRRAPCPVLVVPEGYDGTLQDDMTVVLGIRGGDRDDAAEVVRQADKLTALLGAELVIVHSAGKAERTPGDAAWLEEVAGGRRHMATHGNPAQELMRFAAEINADAVAVAPRGHGPLRQALLGTVSSGLISAGERPVFVIPRTHKPRG